MENSCCNVLPRGTTTRSPWRQPTIPHCLSTPLNRSIVCSNKTKCLDSLLHEKMKVTNAKMSNKRVSFGKVSIRSHNQVLSCNPSCSDGPAISLGWEIKAQVTMTVDSAEAYRVTTRRRSREDLVMERNVREERLTQLGYTVYDLVASVREITKIQHNRWQSIRHWQRQEVAKARALKIRNIINRLRGRNVETIET